MLKMYEIGQKRGKAMNRTENRKDLMRRYAHLNGEINGIYHDISAAAGISDSVSYILYTLYVEDRDLTLSELCDLTGTAKQTLHSALTKLEKDGVITIIPKDKKSKLISLTGPGREFTEKTAKKVSDAENAVLGSWSEKDVKTYIELTTRFRDGLEEQKKSIISELKST